MKTSFSFARILTPLFMAVVCAGFGFCDEIHDAVKDGDLAKVKALLAHSPNLVSSKDGGGQTPLHLAARGGNRDMAETLLAAKADVNAKDNSGLTALHLAAKYDEKDVAEVLLAHGADVNAPAEDGTTPLHLAAKYGRGDMVQLLLEKGGYTWLKDKKGATPSQLAEQQGHKDVVKILSEHAKAPPDGFVKMPDFIVCKIHDAMRAGSEFERWHLVGVGSLSCKKSGGKTEHDVPLVSGDVQDGSLATKSFGQFFLAARPNPQSPPVSPLGEEGNATFQLSQGEEGNSFQLYIRSDQLQSFIASLE